LRFCPEGNLLGKLAFFLALRVFFPEPLLRNKQTVLKETVAMTGGIGGNGFNELSFQLAHLARHVLKEILPRLLSGKAIGKLGMKASELLNKLADANYMIHYASL
jgi:hypothetical protein